MNNIALNWKLKYLVLTHTIYDNSLTRPYKSQDGYFGYRFLKKNNAMQGVESNSVYHEKHIILLSAKKRSVQTVSNNNNQSKKNR